MQELYDLRRANLKSLIDDRFGGSQTRFAARAGLKHSSFVSRLLTDNPSARKNIGERMARSFEAALGLPPTWLDAVRRPAGDHIELGAVHARRRDLTSTARDVVSPAARSESGILFDRSKSSESVPEASAAASIPVYTARSLALVDNAEEAAAVLQPSDALTIGHNVLNGTLAFRLDDDSMADRFPVGTLAIIGEAKGPRDGHLVAVVLPATDRAVLRQWAHVAGRSFLIPHNSAHAAVEMTSGIRVLGIAVEVRLQLT